MPDRTDTGTGNPDGAGGMTTAPGADAGLNCANVGCGPPPLCGQGCQAACGCCPCSEGERNGNLLCSEGCYDMAPVDAACAPDDGDSVATDAPSDQCAEAPAVRGG